jgi:hypothetical protein
VDQIYLQIDHDRSLFEIELKIKEAELRLKKREEEKLDLEILFWKKKNNLA